jgi:methionyl-tRNA formyltransferase
VTPWRAVIATRILPVALGFYAALREAGHEPVALLTIRDTDGRYGSFDLGGMLGELPTELDILMAARRASIAPLLESVRPDLVVCMGFPWKVPAAALAVPGLGWLNGHPSLLPSPRAGAGRLGDPRR